MKRSVKRIWSMVILTASAGALTACTTARSPHIASLGKGGSHRDETVTTTLSQGTPIQQLGEWAACMRGHGRGHSFRRRQARADRTPTPRGGGPLGTKPVTSF